MSSDGFDEAAGRELVEHLYPAGIRMVRVQTLQISLRATSHERSIAALDKAVSDGYLAADAASRTQRSD